jgi:acetyl esterase/lipase
VLVHGGGFTSGDRASGGMRGLCESMAEHGYAAFSIDYRLAPEYTFPAQVDDLGHAVQWLRQPAQTRRFHIDPAHVGVIGSSAGAIMAQNLGTRGTGPLDADERVAAVVSLSGVSLMTAEAAHLGHPSPAAAQLVLSYLGCTSPAQCPQSAAASPISAVDASDPPMLLVNGTDEIVPREQPEAMLSALRAAGVPADLVLVDGSDHGAGLLDGDVRSSIHSFLRTYL